MAIEEQVKRLKAGVDGWNEWRRNNPQEEIDLVGAELRATILRDAILSQVNLRNADLSAVELHGATLEGSYLQNVNLGGSNLYRTNLREADLQDASLVDAYLNNTDLYGANFSGVRIAWTTFCYCDLRETKSLAEMQHGGPSTIDLPTVQLPQDGSALVFLRGAGVPDEWIDFYRSTMMHPIQYHSCFISHSSKDDLLARRLHADLQASGVRCWFAPHDMKIGDRIRTRIDEAIHLQDKLLLLLSEHALASNWVRDEVEAAFEKEDRQQRDVLFPVRLDDSVMQTAQAWAAKLRRTRHIGDFTRWKEPESYQHAFTRLLRDLKAGA